MNIENKKTDYLNSRGLHVMKIVALSFAILAVVVFVTVTLFRWISELNAKIKNSQTRIAKISARLNRLRRARVKHILRLRKAQKKQDKKRKKLQKKWDNLGIDKNDSEEAADNDNDENSVISEADEEYLAEEIEDIGEEY